MRSTKLAKTLAALTLTAGTLAALPAHAHITMQGALKSRGGDQKSSPCDGSRGDGPVYMFEPGTVITLSASEDVPHPSYFRIAFDNDRDDNFIEPKSIKPIDPNRGCPVDSKDQCGQSDFCNVMSTTGGATVLWDNIDPHLAGGAKTWTWTIKLPDVECENCTIQVLQIMEDDLFHGAYCPTGSCTDSSLEDIYHRCIDITLKKGATNSPGVATGPVSVKGMECSPSTVPTAGTGAGGMSGTGGAAAGAGGVAGAAIGAGASGGAAGAGAAGIGMGSSANTGAGAGGTAATAGAAAPGAAGRAAGAAGGVGIVTPPTPAGSGATTAGSMAVAGAPAPTSGAPAPGPSSDGGCSVTSLGQTQASAAAWLLLMAALVFVRRRHAR